LLDWSAWFGYEKARRIVAAIGVVIFVMRLITRSPCSFWVGDAC
jgi:hypothetical protein